MTNFLLNIGAYALVIIAIILIIFIAWVTSLFYNWILDKKSIVFSRIISSFLAIALCIIVFFSFYGAHLQFNKITSFPRVVAITSKVEVGTEAYLFFSGAPNENFCIKIDDYYTDDYIDERKTDSDGLAVFHWPVSHEVDPGTYKITIQNSDLEDVSYSEFTVI